MKSKYNIYKLNIKQKRGFTLIEVIIAVSIVVILSSLAVPKVSAYLDKAKNAKIQALGKQIYTAAMWSYADQGNSYVETEIKDAIEDTVSGVTDVTAVISNDIVTISFDADDISYNAEINTGSNSYTINENTDDSNNEEN